LQVDVKIIVISMLDYRRKTHPHLPCLKQCLMILELIVDRMLLHVWISIKMNSELNLHMV
jgi:hypothetical protein